MGSPQGGASRLQKLLNLIDGGSSLATRKAAVAQIAGITAAHPAQLPAVIAAVSRHLRHREWDARVAAGHCLGLLAEHFQHHTPADLAAAAAAAAGEGAAAGAGAAAAGSDAAVKAEPAAKAEGAAPAGDATPSTSQAAQGQAGAHAHLLSFAGFDVQQVLSQGTPMLASGGEEYDVGAEPGLSRAEQLRRQRGNLKQRLGLGGPMDGLMDTDEMFGDDDLLLTDDQRSESGVSSGSAAPASRQRPGRQATSAATGAAAAGGGKGGKGGKEHKDASQLLADMSGMSARERAAAARRAKALKRSVSTSAATGGGGKRAKAGSEPANGSEAGGPAGSSQAAELDSGEAEAAEADWGDIVQCGRWPFQALCDQLCVDVLHPQWEVRHGAALALREVLSAQAGAAGVTAAPAAVPGGWSAAGGSGKLALGLVGASDAAAAAAANAGWLEDCAIHLLCVLALDRFGDFISDQVVAPVRETAAQALGAAARPLPPASLPALLRALRRLSEHLLEWEVRHGGLLGLKYVLAARPEGGAGGELLEAVLPAAVVGLQDSDDDVQAVAAEALLPAAGVLASPAAPPAAQAVLRLLWDALLELEELSPATGSVMALLAEVHSSPASTAAAAGAGSAAAAAADEPAGAPLGQLVPRLWPFLRHGLTSVRHATLRCLSALLRSRPVASLLPGDELHRAARLLFQCLLLEKTAEVLAACQASWELLVQRSAPDALAAALPAQPALAALFSLAATPAHSSLDASLMLSVPLPRKRAGAGSSSKAQLAAAARAGSSAQLAGAAGEQQQQQDARQRESLVVEADGDAARTVRMRLAAARALGQLSCALGASSAAPNPAQAQVEALLRGPTASGRLLAAHVVASWAQLLAEGGGIGGAATGVGAAAPGADPSLQHLLGVLLEQAAVPQAAAVQAYAELAQLYGQLRGQASALIGRALQAGVAVAMPGPLEGLGAQGALALAMQMPAAGAPAELVLAQQALQNTAALLQASEALLHTSVAAGLAAAAVHIASLPPKLNTIIQPLVAAIRREPQGALQDAAAAALARLTLLCADRTPCPNDKIVKNMCGFACGDPRALPSAAAPPDLEAELDDSAPSSSSSSKNSKGGKQAAQTPQQQQEELAAQALALARRGGEAVLRSMARQAGAQLQQRLPKLWEQAAAPLAAHQAAAAAGAAADLQASVNALHVLGVLAPAVHAELAAQLAELLPLAVLCLQHANAAVKLAAARCLAALAEAHTQALMPLLLRLLAPLLQGGASDDARLGALLALHHSVAALGLRLVPYSLLVVVPLMGRMSDPQPLARGLAARTFATVVGLMPLAQDSGKPPGLDDSQRAVLASEGRFLQQLLDNKAMDDYALPIKLNGTLRRYQQEGINWLAFLRRFGLHGVLADDMGKTLQTTAIIAAHTHEQRAKFAQTGAEADRPLPSLVVCPSTLVAHWPFEIGKFVGPEALRPLAYHGAPAERAALRRQLSAHDVLVMSYESLRGDVDWVCSQRWSYCVLDEGHAIRNPSSRVAQAAKRAGLAAQHRLLLSGTPVQNSVGELWSLFDFLMPGLLGSERAFNAKYRKTMQAARTSKRGSPEAEAGLLAVEGLHRQVMPFILRRTKDAVLDDLPPKILQDVVVDPSPLQRELYKEFQNSQALAQISGIVSSGGLGGSGGGGGAAPPHVFQSLIYLRKLCSHPLLVLDPAVPEHMQAVQKVLGGKHGGDWASAQAALRSDLAHAPKLLALQELLLDAGIGVEPGLKKEEAEAEAEAAGGAESAGHRVLVFAQLKGLLDLVESEVLAPLRISSLRIDGSVDAAERFRRVQRFNADPTIDVMLLTTATGGLGLNLTAADTVVFLEHDWNPAADLQAMDRAHRLGQRRTVNVYRLLVRGTLEEQVMSLQRFKLDVAATLVNQENVSLAAMDTGNLLDIFTLQDQAQQQPGKQAAAAGQGEAAGEAAAAAAAGEGGKKGGGLAAVLAGLGNLEASEAQYADQFDLQAFQQKLAKQQSGGGRQG